MKNKKYTGILNTPILEFSYPFNDGLRLSERNIEAKRKDTNEEFNKLMLLAKHHGIDENDKHAGLLLALELARAHVPGFKRIKKAGAPKLWDTAKLCELKHDIEQYKKITKLSVSTTCKELANCEPWCDLLKEHRDIPEVLRTQYYNAKEVNCISDEESFAIFMQEYETRKKEK